MLWMKWYQTVFFFIIYNVALMQANLNYNWKYFIPIYASMILSFVYFYFIDDAEKKQKEVEFIDDNIEPNDNCLVNN